MRRRGCTLVEHHVRRVGGDDRQPGAGAGQHLDVAHQHVGQRRASSPASSSRRIAQKSTLLITICGDRVPASSGARASSSR